MAIGFGIGLNFPQSFNGGTPSWVLPGATVDLDFANNRAFGATFANALNCSRASSGTDLLPTSASGASFNTFTSNQLRITPNLGILAEEPRTNVLLNSTTPVTQTSASLAPGTYTLWCNGAGSVTSLAGTATMTGAGIATNGSPNVFIVTVAGTVVFTKAGALNAFQCELGAFGTSLIVTAGTTATRAADVTAFTGAALTALKMSSITIRSRISGVPSAATAGGRIIDFGGPTPQQYGNTTTVSFYDGTGQTNATLGSGSVNSGAVTVSGISAAFASLVANVGTEVTNNNTFATPVNAAIGIQTTGVNALNGYISRTTFWSSLLASPLRSSLSDPAGP